MLVAHIWLKVTSVVPINPTIKGNLMRAIQIFDSLIIAIDNACKNDGFLEMPEIALHLGMSGGRVESFNALRYEFNFSDSEGHVVSLSIRSYDPSGPFQNIPDINRFTAKLFANGAEIASHDKEYSD
jgi:hypothetical protein